MSSLSRCFNKIRVCRSSWPVKRIVHYLDRHWRLGHFHMKPTQWVELAMTVGEWKGRVLVKYNYVKKRKKYPNRRKKYLTNYRNINDRFKN